MIKGLEVFKQHFTGMANNFILIGGAACDMQFSRLAVGFRTTRDLDIVLCVESLSAEFAQAFWKFITAGQYQIQEKANGTKHFYRFRHPVSADFPEMIELFSRHPDAIIPAAGSQLTPLPMPDEISSLSAILLDDDYYSFITTHYDLVEGLAVLSPEALLVLKAKAWMDLKQRRSNGEHVDSKDISKHKNDILRLTDILYDDMVLALPQTLSEEMKQFLRQMSKEKMDIKNLHLHSKEKEIRARLNNLFSNEHQE